MNKAVIIGVAIVIIIGVVAITAQQTNQSNEIAPSINSDDETLVETEEVLVETEETQGKHFTVGISETIGFKEP